jgi:hypothetical protein
MTLTASSRSYSGESVYVGIDVHKQALLNQGMNLCWDRDIPKLEIVM